MNYSNFADDIVDNGTTLVPVCLCLDTSGSMRGKPISELNRGLKLFYDAVRKDEVACAAADICIVTFGNGGAQCMFDFSGLRNRPNPPELVAGGQTPMADAVNKALDLLESRRDEYKRKGVDHYKPWLIIMTDGHPYGDSSSSAVPTAQRRTCDLVSNKKLVVFPIWIGNDNTANGMNTLAGLSPKNPPKKLNGLDFSKFFQWLSRSVSSASQSASEADIKLPPMDWTVL